MRRSDLEHLIRAAGRISGESELVVIGSQAVLGQFPDAPVALLASMEVDLYPLARPELADKVDGAIGEGSRFHQTYGYYAQGVGPETATLPAGWKRRLVRVENRNTGNAAGLCLEVHDLAISKYVAGRAKDREFTRELARRFNHLYGREPGFEDKAKAAVKKLGSKKARLFNDLRTKFLESGDAEALKRAQALLDEQQNMPRGDRERLFGWLEGSGKKILVEAEALLTEASKLAGLDGQKMSKSYGNAIGLREDPETVAKKIRTMPTDPARVKRGDPGTPQKCPVWSMHAVYSDEARKAWVEKGCTTAAFGCLECKQPVIDSVLAELAPIRERAQAYLDDPTLVKNILADGCDKARKLAGETMRDVREAMGLSYT